MDVDSPVRASGLSSVVIPANRDHQEPASEEEITLHDEQLDSPQRKRKHRSDSESSQGYEVNVREVKKQPEGFVKPSSDGELSDTEPKRQKREDRSKDARKERKEEEDQYVGARYWGGRPRQLHRDDPNRGRPYPNDSPPPRDKPAKEEPPRIRKPQEDETISTRTGGAYIPPAKLRMMQQAITDKNSMAYQRLAWEALKKSIHGLINKINTSNINHIIRGLFKENVVRGRGMLCRSIMQAQAASPTFTHVYASLVAIINSKFPNIGELLLKRLVLQFRRGFRRNEKVSCMAATRFIAHLVNQQVAHEILALELLTLLLENPTDDSVEVAVGFLKESGMKLTELSPRGIHAVFERLRHVLHEAPLDKRVKYMIEVMFQVRKDGFKDFPSMVEGLDLVEEQEQFTHLMSLEDPTDPETMLDVFKLDPDFVANEEKYKGVMQDILDDPGDESDDGEDKSDSESASSSEEDEEEKLEKETAILDQTETNLVNLRRTIYLTIQSSLDHNETVHKLMKMQLKPGQEVELCNMILDCCAQQRTYEKFFGLVAQRFCQLNGLYLGPFQQLFRDTYDTIHRLETNRLRNVAKFFAHLLFSDSISWEVLGHVRLNEEETTPSSRIFLKILFQELAEYLGLAKLNERLKDPTLQAAFEGIFPRDDPRNTRFAINYFTSIGLGGLTDELREHLRTVPRVNPTDVTGLSATALEILKQAGDESSASGSDSSSDSSSNSDSDASKKGRKKKRRKAKERLSRAVERQKASPEPSGNKENRREREGVKRRERREEPAHKPSPEHSGNKENGREREDVKRRDRREESAQKPERETRRGGGIEEEVSRQSGRTRYEDRDDSRRLEERRGSGRDRPRKEDDRDDRDGYRTERKRSPRPPSDHSRRHRQGGSRHEEHYRRRH